MGHSRPDFETYALTHRMYGNIPQSRKFVLDNNIKNGMKILDIGCGDGQHLEYLAQRFPKENLYGTEISQIRVDRVIGKGFKCVKVDGPLLPFDGNFFDAIVLFEVIEHIPKTEINILLKEIFRVLSSKGLVIGSTPNYPAKRCYNFLERLSNRSKTLLRFHKPKTPNETQRQILTGNEYMSPYKRGNGNRYLWLKGHIKRFFMDDPTHQFFCNFGIIQNLGTQYFREVELYTTFSGKARRINISNPLKFFSHKIVFVFRK